MPNVHWSSQTNAPKLLRRKLAFVRSVAQTDARQPDGKLSEDDVAAASRESTELQAVV